MQICHQLVKCQDGQPQCRDEFEITESLKNLSECSVNILNAPIDASIAGRLGLNRTRMLWEGSAFNKTKLEALGELDSAEAKIGFGLMARGELLFLSRQSSGELVILASKAVRESIKKCTYLPVSIRRGGEYLKFQFVVQDGDTAEKIHDCWQQVLMHFGVLDYVFTVHEESRAPAQLDIIELFFYSHGKHRELIRRRLSDSVESGAMENQSWSSVSCMVSGGKMISCEPGRTRNGIQ